MKGQFWGTSAGRTEGLRLTITAIALLAASVAAVSLSVLRDDSEPTLVRVDERLGVLHDVRFGESQASVRARLGDETDEEAASFRRMLTTRALREYRFR